MWGVWFMVCEGFRVCGLWILLSSGCVVYGFWRVDRFLVGRLVQPVISKVEAGIPSLSPSLSMPLSHTLSLSLSHTQAISHTHSLARSLANIRFLLLCPSLSPPSRSLSYIYRFLVGRLVQPVIGQVEGFVNQLPERVWSLALRV